MHCSAPPLSTHDLHAQRLSHATLAMRTQHTQHITPAARPTLPPPTGIAEDPVTGSAHSVLGPYWAAALGTPSLRARQCSPRGGELGVEVRAEEGRVVVSGSAVTVFKGHLLLPD